MGKVKTEPNPHAPILTNPGYESIPSIDELAKMTDEQLSNVENFTVIRRGFGEVTFLQPVDVRDLNLDEIIVFEPRSIYIYPDEHHKPAVGRGLNVPAQVSLDRCWPKVPRTKKPLKSVDGDRQKLILRKFKQKLMKRANTEFVSYHLPTGRWTFRTYYDDLDN